MAALIDLHMHTTVSDGTDGPEEILSRVRSAGITFFSVTDHDAIEGSAIVRSLLQDPGPEPAPCFLTGVEFSCRDGAERENKYHILGYDYDPESTSIRTLVGLAHRLRMEKVTKRLERLEELFGISFPEEEIQRLLALPNPGKPHIGNLMVRCGYAPTRDEAISEYIDRLHVRVDFLSPEKAIKGILAAGGIPVLAHPSYGDGGQHIHGTDMENRLRRLKSFGLQGLEAFYSRNTPAETEELLTFADKYDLFVTAGSDYHGRNKRVRLAQTGLAEGTVLPPGLERFLCCILERHPDFSKKNLF